MESPRKLQPNERWHSLVRNQDDKKFCQVYTNYLIYNATISLYPDENLITKAFSKVQPGGTWTPVDCIPQVKGE